MTAVYGTRERARLTILASQVAAMKGSDVLGQAVADKLRVLLPDMDDVAIGRVLVALTTDMAALFAAADNPGTVATLRNGLAAAGLAMTEEEWR